MRNPFTPFIIKNCDGDPYLIRWRLLWTRWFSIYLHHILRSDEDRELHDHPWSFVTILLSGGYREITPKGVKYFPSGSMLHRPCPWANRLGRNGIGIDIRMSQLELARRRLAEPVKIKGARRIKPTVEISEPTLFQGVA